jgi:hypothetical protein
MRASTKAWRGTIAVLLRPVDLQCLVDNGEPLFVLFCSDVGEAGASRSFSAASSFIGPGGAPCADQHFDLEKKESELELALFQPVTTGPCEGFRCSRCCRRR